MAIEEQGQTRTCRTCAHFRGDGRHVGGCRTAHASWYPSRGYGPCMYWCRINPPTRRVEGRK